MFVKLNCGIERVLDIIAPTEFIKIGVRNVFKAEESGDHITLICSCNRGKGCGKYIKVHKRDCTILKQHKPMVREIVISNGEVDV